MLFNKPIILLLNKSCFEVFIIGVLKGNITIKRKRRWRKASKDQLSQGVVERRELGGPTFVSIRL